MRRILDQKYKQIALMTLFSKSNYTVITRLFRRDKHEVTDLVAKGQVYPMMKIHGHVVTLHLRHVPVEEGSHIFPGEL